MTYIEAKIQLTAENPDMAHELITHILQDLDISGSIIEELDLKSAKNDFKQGLTITAYLPENVRTESLKSTLETELHRMTAKGVFSASVSYRPVEEKDWSESWKAFFKPEKISPQMVIKPSWQPYDCGKGEMIIEIDPGMAFGTGTHPTTSLSLNLLEKYLVADASVLDIGTGSGILTIAAAKLGAGSVTACDNDRTAVEIAKKNLAKNHIDPNTYHIVISDLLQDISGIFQLVTANILTNTIIELLDHLPRVVEKGSVFIASGILAEDEANVVKKMKHTGFQILETLVRDEWVAIVGRFDSPESITVI